MRRIILAALGASLIVFASAAVAGHSPKKSPPIDVMTQNQYLGADLVPIVEAGAAILPCPTPEPCTDPDVIASRIAFNTAMLNALGMVAANLPEQRFRALAREIFARRPQVVGLQEVFDFSCAGPGCSYQAIAGAFNDHLTGTLDALHGTYVAKAIVRNLDITLPIETPIGGALVTVIDRDVILVRRDLEGAASVVPYGSYCSNPSLDGCNYDFVASTSIAGQEVRIERGFVGIDLNLGSSKYRVVNTHLEVRAPDGSNPYSRIVQSAQAYQLILTTTGTATPDRKLIVVGDINSDPRDPLLPVPPELQAAFGLPAVIVPPYTQFAAPVAVGGAGFTDAWTMRPGAGHSHGAPLIGYTCCQDEDLANRHSELYERIDMIFSLTKPSKVIDARLLGTTAWSKTWPPGHGLWPSDHAAVAAALQY